MRWLRKRIKRRLFSLALIASSGAYVYYVLLTPEARKSLSDMSASIKDSYATIAGALEEIRGIVMVEEEDVLPNRQATKSQWEELGF